MVADQRVHGAAFARLLGAWRSAGDRNLATRLAEQTTLLVRDGRLPAGMKLPAERDLAMALGISRTTVASAYNTLRSEAVLESRQGSGTWVTMRAASMNQNVTPWLPGGSAAQLDLSQAALPAPADLANVALPYATECYPAYGELHGYSLLGLPELRAAIAQRFTLRGLPTSPEEVLVTTGAQQAIALTLACFVEAGSRVLVDHPTYPNALDAIARAGGRATPIGFGSSVCDIALLGDTARNAAPRLIYLVPDFHNPTGVCMSEPDRQSVIDIAHRTSTPLLIDETLTELHLSGPAPRPLASFGRGGHTPVVTVGSVSKIFWGGLRIGWLRAPAEIVRRAAGLKVTMDMSTPVFEQLITARLLRDIEAIADTRRHALVLAQDHLIRVVGENVPSWTVHRSSGGLSLWVDLGEPLSSRLAVAARHFGVMVTPGPRFGIDGAFERFLRLPYTLDSKSTEQATGRLAQAWAAVTAEAETPTAAIA